MKKTAVILFNLGGPDSKNAIRPFLMNFFMDKNIIRLPVPFRCLLAWRISTKRSSAEAGESYGLLGDKSPLLENSQAQAQALEKELNASSRQKPGSGQDTQPGTDFKVFVCMRYWHPMADQVVREVRDWGADDIMIVPLYPQFSTTTTWSSLQTWNKAMHIAGYERPTSMVCCYPRNQGFIKASAENIRIQYEQAQKDGYKNPRILFSAHGLPESIIKDGDPYQWQCEESMEAIVKDLAIENLDYNICYQSRVGRQKWIGPSLDEELKRAGKEGAAVIVYPHAFTQEHVETLVELDIEYKHLADALKIPAYYRAKTVSTHPDFIAGLAQLVKDHNDSRETFSENGSCICPETFGRCCMRG